MIKLIAIDMDGTLLNEKKHIDKAQKEAIHEAIEAGIKIVLCYMEFCHFMRNLSYMSWIWKGMLY